MDSTTNFSLTRNVSFDIPMNDLATIQKDQLESRIAKIAAHINEGKVLAIRSMSSSVNNFVALNKNLKEITSEEKKDHFSLSVQEALNRLVLQAHELKVDSKSQTLTTISSYCCEILREEYHLLNKEPQEILPPELWSRIFAALPNRNLIFNQTVSKHWLKSSQRAVVDVINHKSLRLYSTFLGDTLAGPRAVDWLCKHPNRSELKYVNLLGFSNVDNDCLKRLVESCPNIHHLNIIGSYISGDALKYLDKLKNLRSLAISHCNQLEVDALKHLVYVPNLEKLDINYCTNLEEDALQHLVFLPNLQSLEISGCVQLKPNSLKHLVYVPNLRSLQIAGCVQFKPNSLKHLVYVPNLQSLNIDCCDNLETDALKHLQHVKYLQELCIARCDQLPGDNLSYLAHVPNLQSLNIMWSHGLQTTAALIKHLAPLKQLQELLTDRPERLDRSMLPKHLQGIILE